MRPLLPPQSSSLLAWRSTSRPINSQVLYADRMVGAVRDAQDPVDLKKLGRGERKLQAEEKDAQRIIRKLQQFADGHAGGGVPELDTLKSLTPSELKLLATKCGEQGLDRTHTAIAHSLFWWIQSCGGVSFAVSIGVGRVWTGPSRKPAKAVEAPCCKPAKPRAQACLVNGLPPAPRRRSTVPKGLLLALPNASASTSSGSPALHGAMRAVHGEAAQALLGAGALASLRDSHGKAPLRPCAASSSGEPCAQLNGKAMCTATPPAAVVAAGARSSPLPSTLR